MGIKSRWCGVQDMVAWGLQQNDLKLLKVLRCNNSSKILYMGPKTKTLGYWRGEPRCLRLKEWWYYTHDIMTPCNDKVGALNIVAWCPKHGYHGVGTPSWEQTNVWRLLVTETPLGTKAILHLDNHGSQKSNAWFWFITTTIKNSNTCVLVGHVCCFVNNHWLWFFRFCTIKYPHVAYFIFLKIWIKNH